MMSGRQAPIPQYIDFSLCWLLSNNFSYYIVNIIQNFPDLSRHNLENIYNIYKIYGVIDIYRRERPATNHDLRELD